MADVTVKRVDEMESYHGQFVYAGKGLGVSSWGMNILRLPPGWGDYPLHDHASEAHEEAYIVMEGSATLYAEGESWALEPGTMARVGPAVQRRIVPGPRGVTILALGGTLGKPYAPSWGRKAES